MSDGTQAGFSTRAHDGFMTFSVDLKIQKLTIDDVDFFAVVRFGWQSGESTVFNRWKPLIDGETAWNRCMVHGVVADASHLVLILCQKRIETQYPIGIVSIPVSMERLQSNAKQRFQLPVERMLDGRRAMISGWYRTNSVQKDRYVDCESQSRTWSTRTNSGLSNEFSVEQSVTPVTQSGTMNSVDLSLDLTGDIPKKFYPLCSQRDVFTRYLHSLSDDMYDSILPALKFMLSLPENTHEFQLELADPVNYTTIFIELGLICTENDSIRHWIIRPKSFQLSIFQEAVAIFLQGKLGSES